MDYRELLSLSKGTPAGCSQERFRNRFKTYACSKNKKVRDEQIDTDRQTVGEKHQEKEN
ncbi:MAG: hypothetical protein QHH06_02820 [Clostridiales bacterium]|jgi:hypothetical protein|nr:hypothetical protein [Eubacteriales bacterium]MDH7565402.1 hypothetical protein [Clostridiales bacterium]